VIGLYMCQVGVGEYIDDKFSNLLAKAAESPSSIVLLNCK